MADKSKPPRKERFTMLEPSGPINPSPEELATRVVEPLINGCPVESEPPTALSPAVQSLLAQLTGALDALNESDRAVALNCITAELTKRLAG